MQKNSLTITEVADLLKLDAERGIIDQEALLRLVMSNKLPRIIRDVRDELRWTMEKKGDKFNLTKYTTALSKETIGEIY
jgi:hypothetical protein